MKCDCGKYHASNVAKEKRCSCGRTIQIPATPEPPPRDRDDEEMDAGLDYVTRGGCCG